MQRTTSEKTSERIARKALASFLTSILLVTLPVFAADKQKDEDTLQQANIVLNDMLSDKNISPALLSKADCMI